MSRSRHSGGQPRLLFQRAAGRVQAVTRNAEQLEEGDDVYIGGGLLAIILLIILLILLF